MTITPDTRRCRYCRAFVDRDALIVDDGREFCPECRRPMARRGSRRRRGLTRRTVVALALRDGGHCAICGRWLGSDVHSDHVVALSNGGHNGLSNLRLTHDACNNARNDGGPGEAPLRP